MLQYTRLWKSIGLVAFASASLLVWQMINQEDAFNWWLLPNLALAFVPLLLSELISFRATYPDRKVVGLSRRAKLGDTAIAVARQEDASSGSSRSFIVRRAGHRSTQAWGRLTWVLIIGWLLFIPNSFYIFTDFIHTPARGYFEVMDVINIASFALLGMTAGYLSIYQLHSLMLKRSSLQLVRNYLISTFGLIGFALYLGRYVRLNSWDIFIRPIHFVREVLDVFSHVSEYPTMIAMSVVFGLFVGVWYWLWWQISDMMRNPDQSTPV